VEGRLKSIAHFTDAAAILNSIVSNIYYAEGANLPPHHPRTVSPAKLKSIGIASFNSDSES